MVSTAEQWKRHFCVLKERPDSAKTKYMVTGRKHGSSSGVGSEVELDRVRYEVVDEFVYLG